MDAAPERKKLCPLCESPNACALAETGDPNAPCWCRTRHIPKRLLRRIPIADRGVRCICEACIDAFRRAPTVPEPTR